MAEFKLPLLLFTAVSVYKPNEAALGEGGTMVTCELAAEATNKSRMVRAFMVDLKLAVNHLILGFRRHLRVGLQKVKPPYQKERSV